jgi:hypothetical protein
MTRLNGRDIGILAGWIAAFLLVGSLLWFFTRPVRTRLLMESVNRVLEQTGREERLSEALTGLPGRPIFLGTWFALEDSEDQALIFPIMVDGLFLPCMAMVSPAGTVAELIPLNTHSRSIGRGIIKTYIRRIEGNWRRSKEQVIDEHTQLYEGGGN